MTHSSIVYVFDQDGNARLLVSSMATPKPDIDGTAEDLHTLIAQHQSPGFAAADRADRVIVAVARATSPLRRTPGSSRTMRLPSWNRSDTGTLLPGVIAAVGDMHIR